MDSAGGLHFGANRQSTLELLARADGDFMLRSSCRASDFAETSAAGRAGRLHGQPLRLVVAWVGGPAQLLADPIEPIVGRPAVRSELFQHALLLAVYQSTMRAKPAGHWSVDERARIVRTHLKDDSQLEFAERLPVPGAMQIVQAVAPDERKHADRRPVTQHRAELFGRIGRASFSAAREAEIVLPAAQIAQTLQSVNEHEHRRPFGVGRLLAPRDLGRQLAGRLPDGRQPNSCTASPVKSASRAIDADCSEPGGLPSRRKNRAASAPLAGCWAARLTNPVARMPSAASSFCPTISRLLPLCRASTIDVGSLMATASPSHARATGGRFVGRPAASSSVRLRVPRRIGWHVSFEDNLWRQIALVAVHERTDRVQINLTPLVGQPHDLERMVAFDEPVRVVIDRFARRDSSRAAELSSLRMRCALASLHCSAMRTAICPSVLRASVYVPASVCEPSKMWMPNARPWRTRRSSNKAASWAILSSSTKNS